MHHASCCIPHFVGLVLAIVLAIAPLTHAQDAPPASGQPAVQSATSESLAGAFFVSKATHANGEQSIDPIGSILLWTLIALSVVNLGLIGFLALANQRKTILPEGVVAEVKRLLNTGDYKQALELTRRDESFFSQVLHAGLSEASHGLPAIVRSLEQAADVKITTRLRPVELLYMLGQISPMMGLLGTVYGIIYAFRVFVSMGGHASPALLAGGIGTALVATFWGLVVAIPALAGYSVLRNKIDLLTMQATVAAEELLMQFRPKPAASSPASVAKPATVIPPATPKPNPAS
jgi:biopolymer transport protein ExbB